MKKDIDCLKFLSRLQRNKDQLDLIGLISKQIIFKQALIILFIFFAGIMFVYTQGHIETIWGSIISNAFIISCLILVYRKNEKEIKKDSYKSKYFYLKIKYIFKHKIKLFIFNAESMTTGFYSMLLKGYKAKDIYKTLILNKGCQETISVLAYSYLVNNVESWTHSDVKYFQTLIDCEELINISNGIAQDRFAKSIQGFK
jgi:hypothetical protein